MPPNEQYTVVDIGRLALIVSAIVISNFFILVYFAAAMGSRPGQDNTQVLTLLGPVLFCVVLIGALCKSPIELGIASYFAVFFWPSWLFLNGLFSGGMSFALQKSEAQFFGIVLVLTFLLAILGQMIRSFTLNWLIHPKSET